MGEQIYIIGAGIAAINAIKAIREVSQDINIDLFGEEHYYPYNRIRLSKSLFENLGEENILLQKKDWYAAHKVTLHLNTKVQRIDPLQHELIPSDGQRRNYDKLLITTGARSSLPSIRGIESDEISTIRNLDHVQKLKQDITEKKIVLQIGGGIQGLETAWILNQHNKQALIAEIQPRLLPLQLDEGAAAILKERIEATGIKVFTNSKIVEITRKDNSKAAITEDGTIIPCDSIIYAIGIKPNIDLLLGTPVRTARGIIVNDKMATNIENIYAAGDVAEFEGQIYGLWNIAVEQGKTAGYNMINQVSSYRQIVPVTTLNAFGLSLFSMGNISEHDGIKTIVNEDKSGNTYKKLFIKNNNLVGAIVIGDISKSPVFKAAIEKQTPLDSIYYDGITFDELAEQLKNLQRG